MNSKSYLSDIRTGIYCDIYGKIIFHYLINFNTGVFKLSDEQKNLELVCKYI